MGRSELLSTLPRVVTHVVRLDSFLMLISSGQHILRQLWPPGMVLTSLNLFCDLP